MQVQSTVYQTIPPRPSQKQRCSQQTFFTADEGYDIVDQNSICQFNDVVTPENNQECYTAFEQQFNRQCELVQQQLEQLVPEVRMYYMVDKDSGRIFDMRNPEAAAQMQLLMSGSMVLPFKESAWKDYMKLSKKMNELLLDYTEIGDIDSIHKLLEQQNEYYLNIDSKALDDWTPLHIACNEDYPFIVTLLLDNGASIESLTKLHRTPLCISVLRNSISCSRILIERGANVNVQDKEFNTPLHIAAQQGNDRMVQILLTAKADPWVRNGYNQNCLQTCSDVKTLRIFNQFGIEQQENNYDIRMVIPGTDLMLRNNRSDHVIKLMHFNKERSPVHKLEEQKGQTDNQRKHKFMNYAKYVKVQFYNQSETNKLTPQQFNFYQLLGKGSFGEVYLVDKIGQDRSKLYAMKILRKDRMVSQNLLKYVQTEKDVLSIMDHPFIVKLNYAFQTESKLFIVMDYCPGGDLSQLLDIKRKLLEEEARIYVAEILLALECLHKHHIIFRDLKPENVVIDPEGHAMLTDFGLSKKGVQDGVLSKSFCGSPAYLPPEILSRQGHNRQVDWYLLGVLTYELLVGIPPYYANDREQLFDNIKRGPLKIPRNLSTDAKSFIVSLLNRDPSKRLGSERDGEEVREHCWLKDINWEDCYNRQLKPPKPIVQPPSRNPLKISFNDEKEDNHRVNGWTFYEET